MAQDETRQLEAIEKLIRKKLVPQTADGFWPSWVPRPETAPAPVVVPVPVVAEIPVLLAPASSTLTGLPEGVKQARPGRSVRGRAKREVPALLLPPRYKVNAPSR